MKTIGTFLFALCVLLMQCKPTQVSTSKSSFENTHWRLAEMNGNPIITLDGSHDIYITMKSDKGEKRIGGFAGCNSITGGYTLTGTKVKFTIATTMMMCPAEQMEVEDFLLKALSSATSYQIDGDTLQLLDGQTTLATFKAIAR